MIVPDTKAPSLLPKIYENVERGATVYTDEHSAYRGIRNDYTHYVINHAQRYVDRHITTNRIENFWSCLKRTLKGAYICARPFHLQAYVEEQVFRFNEREDNDGGRFLKALKGTDGRRITYEALTTGHPRWRAKPERAKRSSLYEH